jgi:acetone carboxylase gamma subunit
MNAVEIYEKASWDLEHNKITLREFEERIKPLYDVEPIKHGHWIKGYRYCDALICSECGTPSIVAQEYCCKCGAMMDDKVRLK